MNSRILLTSSSASARITLLDSLGATVTESIGALDADVTPGIYRVLLDTGTNLTEELLVARPGLVERFFAVPMHTATPLKDDELDAAASIAVRKLSLAPRVDAGSGSRIVVFVHPTQEALHDFDSARIESLDLTHPVVQTETYLYTHWIREPGFAALSANVAPDTYVIRSAAVGDAYFDDAVDQVVTCVDGWTTLVFIPFGFTDGEARPRPLAEDASVHMVRLDDGFPSEGKGAEAVLAAEFALQGLLAGAALLPHDSLSETRELTAHDPMLGIYAAHALLRHPSRPPESARDLVDDLSALIPTHPDVFALTLLTKNRNGDESGTDVPAFGAAQDESGVSMPPMLAASYDALVARTAVEHDLIQPDSVAEWAASNRSPDGIWTRWTGWERYVEQDATDSQRIALRGAKWSLSKIRSLDGFVHRVLRRLDDDEFDVRMRTVEPKPFTRLLASAYFELTDYTGAERRRPAHAQVIDDVVASSEGSTAELARRFGLPYNVVARSRRAMEPEHD